MADTASPHCLGPSARASSTHRKAAGTKQTRALKPEDASRRLAELEAAVQRKVECERKAVRIVEQLLEENITEEFLKECGMFITPAHYSDVVDERAIIKLCGYPLCQKKLGAIPKQKYKISTKTNKVYDITERKSFCSNFCYRASKFFETQIPKTPVWVREEERPPDFQLLKEGQSGRSGEVVQFFSDAVTAADIDGPGARGAQSEATAPSAWCDHTTDDEQDFVSSLLPGHGPRAADTRPQPHRESSISKKKAGQRVTSRRREQTVADVTERLGNCRLGGQEEVSACELPSERESTQISSPGPSAASDSRHSVSEVSLVGISKKSAEHFRVKFAKSNQGSGPASAKARLLRVLKDTLTEWKTEETLKFLYGPDHASVCPIPPSAPVPHEELDEDDLSCGPAVSQPQNSLDETLPFRGSDTAMKPLPSYESLKKETEMLNLRVREFYRGHYVLNEETTKSQDPGENGFQRDTSFPLIDSSSQNQIRRRIVLEKLSKVLPGLLGPLQVTIGDIYSELKSLVQTFRPEQAFRCISTSWAQSLLRVDPVTAMHTQRKLYKIIKPKHYPQARGMDFDRCGIADIFVTQNKTEPVLVRNLEGPDQNWQPKERRPEQIHWAESLYLDYSAFQFWFESACHCATLVDMELAVQTKLASDSQDSHFICLPNAGVKRLTPILGIQKHSPKNVVFTQFIATLLTELHLKCEDLENLTTVFRTSC